MPDKFNQSYEQTRTYIQRPGCRVHVLVWVCVAWRCVPLANTRYSSHGHKSSWPKPILHTFISNKYRHMGHKSVRKRNEHGALAMANANNTRRAHTYTHFVCLSVRCERAQAISRWTGRKMKYNIVENEEYYMRSLTNAWEIEYISYSYTKNKYNKYY